MEQNTNKSPAPDISRVMEQLITDHKNLAHLLKLLQEKFELLISENVTEDEDEGNALPMILETLEYISLYPQKWHHPAEEVAFDILQTKTDDPSAKSSIKTILSQHRELEQETQELNDYFSRIAQDSIIPLDELSKKFNSYLNDQRKHLDTENQLVFPLLIEYLDDKDWDNVCNQVVPNIDPLFKERSKYEYKTLSNLINDYKMPE